MDRIRTAEAALLENLRSRRAALTALLEECSSHWGFEDPVYRFYHQSFKVYFLQSQTTRIVGLLESLAPDRSLNPWFREIGEQGTGRVFKPDDNADWTRATRPILEAFRSSTRDSSSKWRSVTRRCWSLHCRCRADTRRSCTCTACVDEWRLGAGRLNLAGRTRRFQAQNWIPANQRRIIFTQPAMRARTFWRTVTLDRSDLLDRFLALLRDHHVRYCLVGGQAVNAYVDPVVSLDLDLAVAAEDLTRLEPLIASQFHVERFPHSVNVSAEGSDLRIQIQTDPRYAAFPDRSATREVLGLHLPVARVDDVLRGKVWAAEDPERRASKRQKDLADIARLLEKSPELRELVPASVLQRLV